MIVARRTPPAAMLAAHNRVAAAVAAEDRTEIANVGVALEVWTPIPLYFRGRRILPRPVSWEDGLRLLEAADALERWARTDSGDLATLRTLFRRVADLCWIAARPRWLPAWAQRLRRNPFRRATEAELREVLRFFGRCRTISLVGYRSRTDQPRRPTS